jgi:hypothetical protein
VVEAFVPVIPSPKQTIMALVPVFHHAYCPSDRKHFHQDSNQGQFFEVVASISAIYSSKQTTLVFVSCHSSVVLSFQATGIALTKAQTEDNFVEVLTFSKSLPGLKE